MAASMLSPTQRYAAGALLALALRQAQVHQSRPLGSLSTPDDDGAGESADRCSSSSSSSSSGGAEGDEPSVFWTHESQGLLRPVFRFLEIDSKAWPGLEETAASSPAKHHIAAFLRIIYEEDNEASSDIMKQVLALTKAVDVMAMSLESVLDSIEVNKEKERDRGRECLAKNISDAATCNNLEHEDKPSENVDLLCPEIIFKRNRALEQPISMFDESSILAANSNNYQRRIALLFEILSACLADSSQDGKQNSRRGYDARHRAALRCLATWLDVKWLKVEAIEIMVACSAMAAAKGDILKKSESSKSKWSKWKRGGIIGAAAITGGALLAITGGLAAPAIAAGFGALAPTLGTIIPVIGASGFAAAAGAAGSVAGSLAVAASFGAAGAGLSGSKMARRIGSVEEFEFRPIGENHNQGRLAVGILVSGFVFEAEDFVRPWEEMDDNLERYALQWESKYLIAVSTAIQDWLKSRVTLELMKHGAMLTVLSTLVSALAWPAWLLSATDFIDSKWSMAIDRSDKAGKLLAEVLIRGLQGNRPVTLVGFSLGARVIFKCLQQLAESGDNEGLVERVVLLGAPIPHKGEHWGRARKMVAGRFVNVFSSNDWILGITFRASLLTQGLAGIQAVDTPGIENVDATDLIDGHSSYLWGVHHILQQLELDSYYPVFLSTITKP